MNKKVVFLYSELAGYTVECFNYFLNKYDDYEIHVMRWPLKSEAPFSFDFNERIRIYQRENYKLKYLIKLVTKLSPSIIICCGWWDKDYVSTAKYFKGKIRTVLMFDNYWEASLRQKLGLLILPWYLKRSFDKCWVPGEIQKEYALKLGFKKEEVSTGFYSNNLDPFIEKGKESRGFKSVNYPKTILYVGRYLELKGVVDLWTAFSEWKKEEDNDWKLICVGAGELYSSRVKHKDIEHLGFLQGESLLNVIQRAGVFIMPSHYDHWGMAVQEFASSGMPLICSDRVGAASQFLEENRNGFLFSAKNISSLKNAFRKLNLLSNDELLEFGAQSQTLSGMYGLDNWNNELIKMIED